MLLSCGLITSPFARGLFLLDETVMRDGSEAPYFDSFQLLCGYFSWIAPHVKPVIMKGFCSLVTKFRGSKLSNSGKWIEFISCYYDLQSRVELFCLYKICCETLENPCIATPHFVVPKDGIKTDMLDFSPCVRSFQRSNSSIPKVELYSWPHCTSSND